jgi:hypothetical protein
MAMNSTLNFPVRNKLTKYLVEYKIQSFQPNSIAPLGHNCLGDPVQAPFLTLHCVVEQTVDSGPADR